MNIDNYPQHPWKIIEEGWNIENTKASESLFSLGNGAMGQRANFEEDFSGDSFQGSYVGGVYYPDKTRVGWWKNGYPEYFAKVLNAPNWIGLHLQINGELFDLNKATKIEQFYRELDMETGLYLRRFKALFNGVNVSIESKRFLSLARPKLGVIEYSITTDRAVTIDLQPYVDAGIKNHDSNWDDQFWAIDQKIAENNRVYIEAHTLKTNFSVGTFMEAKLFEAGALLDSSTTQKIEEQKVGQQFIHKLKANTPLTLVKLGGYVSSRNFPKTSLEKEAKQLLDEATKLSFSALFDEQKKAWANIWKSADINIEGDIKAQQAIRFNIFQLNQTYTGEDAGLNIGPKGFTGEKYGGSTYWDTEAYCIPFYMATKNQTVARNLLTYRYNQLDRAIENAEKLGFSKGAALYPMVTMNGEECHNEWEITFEEIHRNSAIAFAIFNYTRYTGDLSYIPEMGMEVLIGIARFWRQRINFSSAKNKYVILGVTGPNEYENNVNNNWYTNYSARWCMSYAADQLAALRLSSPKEAARIEQKTSLQEEELALWKEAAENMYLPQDEKLNVVLQQDGFLDKELVKVADLNPSERPINQHWSWDRILRSPYIKQADVLQGMYFFEEDFDEDTVRRNYAFYEPFTVHESSLSPCVHSIIAAKLKEDEAAYAFYLRTARLDLDDYNAEVEEGLHITSMAGTWMSIVEGFAGMRVKNDSLSFSPRLPKAWDKLSFKINFRDHIYSITMGQNTFYCEVDSDAEKTLIIAEKEHLFSKEISIELQEINVY
ncbi:family 65 glycosyl hydrolase domain-containing protein [Flavobacteriaceae bacterium]|nr:family 65 glycosyl hydrolase domain-containing protein [Flavobacteriaceae bacterium]